MDENNTQVIDGTYFHKNTPRACAQLLASYVHRDYRVRLFYGDRATGKVWDEEHDVSGWLGRSTGPHKIPIILPTRRSMGGPAVLDNCVLAIMVNGKFVYRDPQFQIPEYKFGPRPAGLPEEYTAFVYRAGENIANFHTAVQAYRWIDFMTGKRMAK